MREGGVKGDGVVLSLGDCRKGDIFSINKNIEVVGVQGYVGLEFKGVRVFMRIRLFIVSQLV